MASRCSPADDQQAQLIIEHLLSKGAAETARRRAVAPDGLSGIVHGVVQHGRQAAGYRCNLSPVTGNS
jgi:hypothetical protein